MEVYVDIPLPQYKLTHLFYENVTWDGDIKKKIDKLITLYCSLSDSQLKETSSQLINCYNSIHSNFLFVNN
jgi:hypothetical protein